MMVMIGCSTHSAWSIVASRSVQDLEFLSHGFAAAAETERRRSVMLRNFLSHVIQRRHLIGQFGMTESRRASEFESLGDDN